MVVLGGEKMPWCCACAWSKLGGWRFSPIGGVVGWLAFCAWCGGILEGYCRRVGCGWLGGKGWFAPIGTSCDGESIGCCICGGISCTGPCVGLTTCPPKCSGGSPPCTGIGYEKGAWWEPFGALTSSPLCPLRGGFVTGVCCCCDCFCPAPFWFCFSASCISASSSSGWWLLPPPPTSESDFSICSASWCCALSCMTGTNVVKAVCPDNWLGDGCGPRPGCCPTRWGGVQSVGSIFGWNMRENNFH